MKRGTEVKKGENKIVKLLRQLNINPNLIMLKITLFTMYGATASLLPYLTIHMQSIGLTVDEISMVYLALPLTTFLSPPITGYLIDKFGQYKPVVVLSLVLNAAFHHSLLLIPHMEMPGEMPSAYVIKHPENGRVEVWWSPCPSRECPEEEEWDMVIADCVDHCLLDGATAVTTTTTTTTTAAPVPTVSIELRLNACLRLLNSTQFVDNHEQLRNDATKQKDLHFIFEKDKKSNARPGKRKPTKAHRPATGIDFSQGKGKKKARMGNAAFFLLIMHPDLAEPVENLGIEMEPAESGEGLDFAERFGEELLRKARINVSALEEEDLRCGGTVLATNLTNNKLKELADDCMLQKCSFREGGPEVCPPDYKESDDSIFWLYFFLRFVGTVMLSGGVTMLDPIALTMIQKYGGEFGRERLFSTIGMAIFSPLTGLLMDRSSRQLDYTDYSAAFYTYDVLLGISAVTILLMPLGVHLPSDNIMRDLLRIVRLPPVLLFIFFLFTLGNFWGFIESFLFLYLKELGAPNYLLGITVTVGTLSSIPFLYGAGKILRKFGHVNIIIIAFFSHAARLMGYSFIENPWWCFPFEAIESVAVHLMWIAAATYCAVLAPKTLLATLIGVLGMAHFSLGRGSGSFLGGWLLSIVGTRESFRVMGFLAIAGGVLYGLLHYFWLRKVELNSNDLDTTVAAEGAEGHHLNSEADETAAASTERLSMVIEMNNRGSLLSLQDCNHHDSYCIKTRSPPRAALEVHHHKAPNPQVYYKDTLPGIPRQSIITSKRVEKEQSIINGENKPCLCHLEGQPPNVHREVVNKIHGHPHRQST